MVCVCVDLVTRWRDDCCGVCWWCYVTCCCYVTVLLRSCVLVIWCGVMRLRCKVVVACCVV